MEQIITLSVVLGIGFSLLIFLAKTQFNDIKNSIEKNNENTNKRIDKLEDETNAEISSLKKDISDIKGDFATSFVLREDFFRAMNSVEDNVRETSRKVDKILMLISDKK